MKKTPQSIIDYRREKHNLQKAMRRLEAKYGYVYELELKNPLPEVNTAAEARAALKRIRNLRKGGTASLIKGLVAKAEQRGREVQIEAATVERLHKAAKRIAAKREKINKVHFELAKEMGFKVTAPRKEYAPVVEVKSEKAAESLIAGWKMEGTDYRVRREKEEPDGTKKIVIMRASDVMMENLNTVLNTYDSFVADYLRDKFNKMGKLQVSARMKAMYKYSGGSGGLTDFSAMWNSKSNNEGVLGDNFSNLARVAGLSNKEIKDIMTASALPEYEFHKFMIELMED